MNRVVALVCVGISLLAGMALAADGTPPPEVAPNPFRGAAEVQSEEPKSSPTVTAAETSWEKEVDDALSGLRADVSRIDQRLGTIDTSIAGLEGSIETLRKGIEAQDQTLVEINKMILLIDEKVSSTRESIVGKSGADRSDENPDTSNGEKSSEEGQQRYLVTASLKPHKTHIYHEGRGLVACYKVTLNGKIRYLGEDGYIIPPCPVTGNEFGISPNPNAKETLVNEYTNLNLGYGQPGVVTTPKCRINQWGQKVCNGI